MIIWIIRGLCSTRQTLQQVIYKCSLSNNETIHLVFPFKCLDIDFTNPFGYNGATTVFNVKTCT